MVIDPAVAEATFSVLAPEPDDRLTLFWLKLAAILVVVRVTTPVKPLTLVRVRVALFDEPAWTARNCGFADIVKSGAELTVTDTIVE